MTRIALSLVALLAWGCSDSGITPPTEEAPNIDVALTGAVNGTFRAMFRAVWNRPSAKGLTKFSIVTPQNPGVGVESFILDATGGKMPAAGQHYGKEALPTVTLTMGDGTFFESDINSQVRIDVTGVGAAMPDEDGSVTYMLKGSAEGFVLSRGSAAGTVTFKATF